MCALGSRDRSVSVWLTSYTRPICVVKDLFDNPIMDLSWCKQPFPGLLACSMDGSVAYLQFSYEEIGYPISQKETEEFFMSKYNCDISASVTLKSNNFNSNNVQANSTAAAAKKTAPEAMKFIENPDILLAQEKKQQEQQKQKNVQLFSENSQLSNGNTNSLMATPSKLHMLTEVRSSSFLAILCHVVTLTPSLLLLSRTTNKWNA